MSVSALAAPPVRISRSKVERPVVTGEWVRRPRLETRLDGALSRTLTVIAAPAGHGKTSTIVAWLRDRNLDAAWLTVDERDASLTRFAAHLAVALDRVAVGMLAGLFALLSVPDRLGPRDLGEAFGEALYDLDRDVLLVVDDFHAAGAGAVADFVAGLLGAAPRRLHTVLSSRGKPPFPLSRLRVAGEVEELTGADFRFSVHETRELLQLQTGELVASERAARIEASVGGWPAAVRLFAIGHGADPPPVAAVDQPADQLLAYLGEEVLSRLPPAQRGLLVRASLLDRFSEPLLTSLATAHDGAPIPRADLDRLRSLDLFREIPGLSETWFSYHRLFRDALRHELERTTTTDAMAALHRHIAAWFASAGLTGDAVQHLVEAGDIPAASALIESRMTEAFAQEDWQAVASWLRLIPTEAVLERPELLLASAWVAYLGGRESRIAEILRVMRDSRTRERVTAAERAEMALLADWPEGDYEAWIRIAEEAIARIPPSKRYRYGYAHMALGMALASAGRADEALARLAAFTERESARIDAASIRGYFGRVLVLWQAGRLARCEQTAADQLQLAQMNDLAVSAGWGAMFLGWVAHERGDLAQATRHFETVIAGAERFHFMGVRDAFFAQILAFQAQGLHEEADRASARLREFVIAAETLHHLEVVDSFVARIALIRGDLAAAERWLESSAPPTLAADDFKAIELPILTRIKVLVAIGTPDRLAEATRLLTAFVAHARSAHMALALLEGLAVQALLHEARGDSAAAARALRESLDLAAPEGIVQRYAYLGSGFAPILRRLLAERPPHPHARTVLDALESVLAAMPRASATETGEMLPEHPLTERELDVMRLLERRLTNNEIGDELFISPITVKNHVAHITDKLGVSGRRAAVERAGELGLFGAAS